MEPVFIQLAIILIIAFAISYIAKLFKQPLIIGYILAGIILSPFILKFGASQEIIRTFSQFGVAFLLFIVGLHLNPKIIKEVGTCSFFVGIAQTAIIFLLGFLVSLLLGVSIVTSVYIGLALSFSSTIIVMKLLSDKKQIDSLPGKISAGILIVQDLIALIALMVISSISPTSNLENFGVYNLLLGFLVIIIISLLGFFIVPKIIKNLAKNLEILFLFSIVWCFAIIGLFTYFGFSIEIGALIAGIILSASPYSIEISSKIRPLRDFFLIIFFVILGLSIQLSEISSIIFFAIIFFIIASLIKPLILMSLMTAFGYTKRTNFFVGTGLGQISEFSLILLALGVSLNQVSPKIATTMTLAAILTIAFSAYLITYSEPIYKKIHKRLGFFEKKNIKRERKIQKKYDAVLFGYNRIGFGILNSLKKIHKNYLVVDFNPDTINNLKKLGIPCIYGDVYDPDLLEELPLEEIKIAISTIPDFETNYLLIEEIRKVNQNAIIICRAHQINDALELYKKGADYVLTPHFLGGEYVSQMIKEEKTDKNAYKNEREKHIKMLKTYESKGQEHPS